MGRLGGLISGLLSLGTAVAFGQEIPRTDWGTFSLERSTGVTSGTIAGHPDSVLARLPGLFADLGLTVKEIDPAERFMVLKRHRLVRKLGKYPISRYLSCGDGLTGPNADSYYVYLTINLKLEPKTATQTKMEMSFGAEAINVPGGQSERIGCGTTGRFELELVSRLQSMFRAPT